MYQPGPRNLITDVPGLRVGHATDENAQTGVTTVICPAGWRAGVDVRGGGPGVRESETLAPENLVGIVHAVVLAGGSVFGLGAADGVAAALSHSGEGLRMRPGEPAIPIVPSAVLYDLRNPGDKAWGMDPPYRLLGVASCAAASTDFQLGSTGAGRGAMAGLIKGGVGSASLDLGDGLFVGALVAVNCVGSVHMPGSNVYWAWPFELNGEFGSAAPQFAEAKNALDLSDPVPDDSRLQAIGRLQPGANTTIGVLACNADLTTVECKRVAMMAQDGMARAIRPAHTPFDGDTLFAIAGGSLALPTSQLRAAQVSRIGSAAADCLARAIARGVHFA